jgi:pimeloyl-ACP methyl ester carboxylesterase
MQALGVITVLLLTNFVSARPAVADIESNYDAQSALAAVIFSDAPGFSVVQKLGSAEGLCQEYSLVGTLNDIGAVFANNDNIVVAYRGTENADDVFIDLQVQQVRCDIVEGCGLIHRGFKTLFDGQKDQLMSLIDSQPKKPVVFVGFSLGAAMATLASLQVAVHRPEIHIKGLITLGSPKVGDGQFVSSVYANVHPDVFNRMVLVNVVGGARVNQDIISTLPGGNYYHVGREVLVQCSNLMVCQSNFYHSLKVGYGDSLRAQTNQCGFI